jgi:hypothetical protein
MIDNAASPSQSPLFQSSSSQLDIHLVHVLTNLVVTQVFFYCQELVSQLPDLVSQVGR